MKRGTVLKLRERSWHDVEGTDLEVCLVPGGVVDFAGSSDRTICRDFFVEFKNYTEDDGVAIENTLSNRIELLNVPHVNLSLRLLWLTSNEEVMQGEDSAVSD